QIKLFRLPRLAVFRKTVGICRYFERFLRNDSRNLMLPVTVARGTCILGNNDFRPEIPNHPYVIPENLVVRPLRECVVSALRKAEFVNRSKELLGMIQAARVVQFFGPDDPQIFEQFTAEQVGAAIAAGGSQVGRTNAFASR